MKTLLILVALSTLVLLSCAEVDKEFTVAGHLTGAEDRATPLAHVHLIGLGGDLSNPVRSVRVADDGSFELIVPGEGYFEIFASAVGHLGTRVPLITDSRDPITNLKIRLAPYRYIDPLINIRIIGDWNDFNWRAAEPMTLQEDGTFIYERPADGDTLAYQLVNAVESGHSVNGTEADYYVYDGGGDYISVLRTEGDEGDVVRVVFDPKAAALPYHPDLPVIDFGDKHRSMNEGVEIGRRVEQGLENINTAAMSYMEEHGSIDGFEPDASALLQFLREKIAGGQAQATRRYAAVRMAGLPTMGIELGQEDIAGIKDAVPVSDGLWSAAPMSMPAIFRDTIGDDGMIELFERDLAKVESGRVKAVMLLEIGLHAKEAGDSARYHDIYDDLTKNYADLGVPWLDYRVRTELNPYLKISRGKPLPDFEVRLMDGGGTVSKETMKGKYWLMDFWATWCGPCVGEMPKLHEAYESFKHANLEVLSISLDRSPEDVQGFRKDSWTMPWHHTFAEGGFEADISRLFEVDGIPKPILVSPEGTIIATGAELRGEALEATLARHLSE
jgi:thiol-disulfide isomerase/thioredoxin